jgi:hypothetical protein
LQENLAQEEAVDPLLVRLGLVMPVAEKEKAQVLWSDLLFH